jgi:hypothetical protein
MATTVKMRPQDKQRLDRLQAMLTAHTGRKISQEELLSRLLGLGERERDALVDEIDRPMSRKEIESLLRLPVRTGVRTHEKDIDRTLYGEGR